MSRHLPSMMAFAASVLIAILISIYPLPQYLRWFRPEAMALVIIYWALFYPNRMGIGLAWLLGFGLDIVEGGVWGANAMACALVAYICHMSYRRMLSYSLSQQTAWVFVFIGIYQLFYNWVQSLDGAAAPVRLMLISNLITATCWPILLLCMSRLALGRA